MGFAIFIFWLCGAYKWYIGLLLYLVYLIDIECLVGKWRPNG